MRVPNASIDRYISFVARDSVSLERKLSLTTGDFSVYLSKNASVPSGMTTPSIQEADTGNMPGVYQLLLDEFTNLDDGHDEEEVIIHVAHPSSMIDITRTFDLYRPKGTEGNTLDITAAGNAGIDWGNIANKTTLNALSATTVGTVTNVNTLLNPNPTTGDIANAVWDELQSDHTNVGTFGEIATEVASILVDTAEIGTAGGSLTGVGGMSLVMRSQVSGEVTDALSQEGLQAIRTDSVAAGGINTITIPSGAASGTDHFVGANIYIHPQGTGLSNKQVRTITAYNPATRVITVAPNWASSPGIGDKYSIITGGISNVTESINAALDDIIPELGVATPAITPSIRTSLMLLYMSLRNKVVVETSGGIDYLKIHNNAGSSITSKGLLDDSFDYTESGMVSG